MISRTKIDDMLYKLHTEAEATDNTYAIWGEYAIRSYVLTGRASTTWIKALMKANPRKILSRIARAETGLDSEAMKVVHKYLKRYCGLEQMPTD